MSAESMPGAARLRRLGLILAAIGATLTMTALAAVAVAKTLTLSVARNAQVTNFNSQMTTLENVAVNSHGRVVYTLSGETAHHLKCIRANHCLTFWFPVTAKSVKKLSKAKDIHGKLGLVHRGSFSQVTLNGHPLYTFVMDTSKDHATGEAINSFGGIWHVVKAAGHSGSGAPPPPPPPPMYPPPY
jgi:predicted lipoprotein with Yx(FWY)xxD motif